MTAQDIGAKGRVGRRDGVAVHPYGNGSDGGSRRGVQEGLRTSFPALSGHAAGASRSIGSFPWERRRCGSAGRNPG